jgi:hypothetical protein
MATIRVKLPYHLQNLAKVGAELSIAVHEPITPRTVLDAVEAQYPMLRGTIREHGSGERRAFLRYFACQEDISFQDVDEQLPTAVAEGREPFIVMGAIAGG